MNYLVVSKSLADFVDPGRIAGLDARISAIAVLMEVLTFGLILSFGGVAIKKAVAKARQTSLTDLHTCISSRFNKRSHGNLDDAATTTASQLDDHFTGSNPMSRSGRVAKENEPVPSSQLAGIELSAFRSSKHSTQAKSDNRNIRVLSVESAECAALPAPPVAAAPPASTPKLPDGWTAHSAPGGDAYYYNSVTGLTSWTLPGAEGFQIGAASSSGEQRLSGTT